MATQFSFVEYLMEQLVGTGGITHKKMFGEYMIYLNGKPIFLVCDDTLFVKALPNVGELLPKAELGVPYEGSKQPYFIVEDIDNRELLCLLATTLEAILPMPKPKKKKMPKIS